MKLKYYMRTLGLGIFVTALLMGFATTPKESVASEESVEQETSREATVLSDLRQSSEELETSLQEETPSENETKETETQSETQEKKPGEEEKLEEDVQQEAQEAPSEEESQPEEDVQPESQEVSSEAESRSEETTQPETQEAPSQAESPSEERTKAPGTSVTLQINRGDSSDRVSRKLAELGMVEDAKAFDRYLCANGYDKRISVGVYEIPGNSTEEEIARIIAGK